MGSDSIDELEKKLEELNRRIPPHSIPPALIDELDELQKQLREAKEAEKGDG